jgi:methyl-CpG-binding domain protein 4
MDTTKRARKKTPVLSAAEQRSDKYRRLPLNQLVPPPCSPYNLLQERYAHDPWKVIVICMLCNGTTENKVSCSLFCYSIILDEYYLTK